MSVPPVESIGNDETLLRLIWSPTDYTGGVYQTSTIPTQELLGDGVRGCSVDRAAFSDRQFIEALLRLQSRRFPADLPLLAPIANQALVSLVDEGGMPRAEARADPLEATQLLPANAAHAQIHATKRLTKSQAKQLKSRLLELFQPPLTLDQAFADRA